MYRQKCFTWNILLKVCNLLNKYDKQKEHCNKQCSFLNYINLFHVELLLVFYPIVNSVLYCCSVSDYVNNKAIDWAPKERCFYFAN